MELPALILIHVFFGALWAGGAIIVGFFVVPAVIEAGPGGGAVMAGVIKRRLPQFMIGAGLLVVLSGVRLYMLRYSAGWLTSPEGIVLSAGALLAIGALIIGVAVQRPAAERLSALAAQVAAAGATPSPAQVAEIEAARARLGKVAKVTAWHLIGATLLMAGHRLAAGM